MELLYILATLAITALLILLVTRREVVEGLSVLAALVAFIGSVLVALKVAASGVYAPFTFASVDSLGAILMVIIGCIGLAVSVYSVAYLRKETAKTIIGFTRVRQYFLLLNLFLATMFLAVMSSSPVLAWISLEATTLSTAFLISFYHKPSSTEAAWKYLLINSVGLLLGFLGTLLYFASSGLTGGDGFITWQELMMNATHLDPLIAKIAFIFVLIGYGTKAGLAPMHTWLPDAHSKAPAPISALMSGVLLNVAFILVLRFKIITDLSVGSAFSQNLLIIFGLFSIFVAAIIIFTQKNYKRLIAYSSVENMGVMALGFGFGGLGIFAAVLHMIYNALTKSALFLSAGTVFLRYGSTKIAKVTGMFTALPGTSIIFLLGFLSITGIPPFGIFLTKVFILTAGLQAHPFATGVALLLVTILFIGFFKHASGMLFGEKPEEVEAGAESWWLIAPPLALMSIVLYLSFFVPPFLQTLISAAVALY